MVNSSPPTNSTAILSLVAAILTVVTFCIGFAPIPFTALICYPASAVLGIVALVSGLRALRQIDRTAQSGRVLALIGVWTGALTLIGVLCFSALAVWLYPRVAAYVQQNFPKP